MHTPGALEVTPRCDSAESGISKLAPRWRRAVCSKLSQRPGSVSAPMMSRSSACDARVRFSLRLHGAHQREGMRGNEAREMEQSAPSNASARGARYASRAWMSVVLPLKMSRLRGSGRGTAFSSHIRAQRLG